MLWSYMGVNKRAPALVFVVVYHGTISTIAENPTKVANKEAVHISWSGGDSPTMVFDMPKSAF